MVGTIMKLTTIALIVRKRGGYEDCSADPSAAAYGVLSWEAGGTVGGGDN